jgi:hypothetical protein
MSNEPIVMRSPSTGAVAKVLPEFIQIYIESGWVFECEKAHMEEGSSMSDHDELIEILWQAAAADRVRSGKDLRNVPVVRSKCEEVADAIIAAGFTKGDKA